MCSWTSHRSPNSSRRRIEKRAGALQHRPSHAESELRESELHVEGKEDLAAQHVVRRVGVRRATPGDLLANHRRLLVEEVVDASPQLDPLDLERGGKIEILLRSYLRVERLETGE